MGAIEGTSIVLIYKKAKKLGDRQPSYSLKVPGFIKYLIILVFVVGFIYTLASLFF